MCTIVQYHHRHRLRLPVHGLGTRCRVRAMVRLLRSRRTSNQRNPISSDWRAPVAKARNHRGTPWWCSVAASSARTCSAESVVPSRTSSRGSGRAGVATLRWTSPSRLAWWSRLRSRARTWLQVRALRPLSRNRVGRVPMWWGSSLVSCEWPRLGRAPRTPWHWRVRADGSR